LYDYGLSTLEQYGLTASVSMRIRGALFCRTEKGPVIIREFHGSEKKLAMEQQLLRKLTEKGCRADTYLENQEGSLVSRDKDQIPYTLQNWFDGRECDTGSEDDIRKSITALAEIHKVMNLPGEPDYVQKDLREEFLRHNQELRKIRRFVRKKGPSNSFEKKFIQSVQWFLEKGEEAAALLQETEYGSLREAALKNGCICHGEYNQHNVLILKDGVAVTNFRHWGFDIQMTDLYRFMRKLLEKYNWDTALGEEMLGIYNEERHISREEWINLKIRFLYPEKYWKLANHYYTGKKSVISGKSVEKLDTLISQREIWGAFPEKCFRRYPF